MAGLEIQFDGAGVTRLIQNLIWLGTREGALAPERAGLLQSLATRLGLDMAGVAELAKTPRFERPPSRSEAEGTYLASIVMLAQSQVVSQADRAHLAELATLLELGLSKPQLHTLARSPAPLAGFSSSADAVDVNTSESTRKKAGARLRARSKKRGISGNQASQESLETLESTAASGSGKLVAIGSAALLLLLALGGGAAFVISRKGEAPKTSTARAPLPPPRAKTEFEKTLDGWKVELARGPDKTLDRLKTIQATVDAALAQGADASKEQAAEQFYASAEWRRAWTDATAIYEDQIRDELLLAAQEGRLADTASILSTIPAEFARGGASWPARLRKEVDAWLAFSKDVKALVAKPKVAKESKEALARIEAAFVLRKRGMKCEAQPTQAFSVLNTWFKDQWECAEQVQAQATLKIKERDSTALRRYGQILLLMGRPSRAYGDRLAREAKAMVLGAVATGNYKSARTFLAGLPTEYVPSGWVKKRQIELGRWEQYSGDVKGLVALKEVNAEALLKGRDLFMEPGDATITPEFLLIGKWFTQHKDAGSEIAYSEWKKTITLEDRDLGGLWFEILMLLRGTDAFTFLREKMGEDFPDLDELEDFKPGAASGTGFYVTSNKILTNHHVIEGHTDVTIQVGETNAKGKVLASDEELDLALVETESKGTPIVGFSPNALPGALVFAFGYGTLGGESTTMLVTRGAISARLADQKRIVFDATINPGNSGGPLVDAKGRLVGVVVAKSAKEEWVDSLGYAVDGQAVFDWLAKQKVELKTFTDEVNSQTPPKNVRGTVVRLLVGVDKDEDE